MSRSVRLRAWQLRALERWAATPGPDFLAVATPGAGKTTFALTAARRHLGGQPRARVIVVAPTQHLKTQWAAAAAAFALHLDPAWASRDRLPADMHGVVVTYQQVAGSPDLIRGLARDAFVVFDELHHAGDERAWGDGIRHAFQPAARRLALSGTPFRSDTTAIPFVTYRGGEAEPDFEYGYGDALAEGGVVRPVVFPRLDGHMEWTAPDGAMRAHTFADDLDRAGTGQRLRTALSLEGQWLPTVLDQAHDQLTRIRRTHPDAGGLVIAIDQDHARGIAALLRDRHGVAVEVATSDDPAASARIARFARGGAPWIVAVRMISEGVDVPRLRVGVYATTTATELFFRQAVGRLVRWTRGVPRQRAFLFVPDDPRLRTYAARIAEQRRHSLRRRGEDDEPIEDLPEDPLPAALREDTEQLSLFAAISATPLGTPSAALADDAPGVAPGAEEEPDAGVTVALGPPPPLPGGVDADASAPAAGTRREQKAALRAGNAERAKAIARLSGRTHQQVNVELNRLAGVRTIGEATVAQLERRLAHADAWLRRL